MKSRNIGDRIEFFVLSAPIGIGFPLAAATPGTPQAMWWWLNICGAAAWVIAFVFTYDRFKHN